MGKTTERATDRMVQSLIAEMVRRLGSLVYQGLYAYDTEASRLLAVSDNIQRKLGLTAEEIAHKDLDLIGIDHRVVENTTHLLRLCINRIPADRYKELYLFLNFDILIGGEKMRLTHKLTPFNHDEENEVRYLLGVIEPSAIRGSETAVIGIPNSAYIYRHEFGDSDVEALTPIYLTQHERAMLQLSTIGLSANDIAHRMHRSEDTVKAYRRSVYEKLGVSNLASAITVVQEFCLL